VKFGDLVEGDILDTDVLTDVLRRHQVFAVMHFAAFLDVGESVRDPSKYYRNNVAGAASVLSAMAAAAVKHFVFSSTCATYGEPIETPIAETHPQQPINSYGESKLAIERALPHFERAHGMSWVALRYFNAAGADPDGEIGEDHAPEIHVIPARHRGGHRRPAAGGVRRRLPDAGRHLPPRLRARVGPCRRAPARARNRSSRPASRARTTSGPAARIRYAK
jgi:UDP-glucose 4-epimerase